MRFLQETTKWNASYSVPNHIYYLKDDKSKVVGYIKHGTKNLIKFSKPLQFDIRGRKFVEINTHKAESDDVYFPKENTKSLTNNAIEIVGSSGKKYYLSKIGKTWNCTCPGFTFRHTCKHVNNVKNGNISVQ